MKQHRNVQEIFKWPGDHSKKPTPVIREILDWLIHFAAAIAATVLIIHFVGQFTIVQGSSMLPTLKNNNILVIEKLTQRFGQLKQGDIVVVKIPEFLDEGKTYAIKRIIAVAGQKISIRDGCVYVDNTRLDEDYINGSETFAAKGLHNDMEIPAGYVYLLGDNRLPGESKDSRVFGPIEASKIVGRFLFKLG